MLGLFLALKLTMENRTFQQMIHIHAVHFLRRNSKPLEVSACLSRHYLAANL